MQVIARAFDYGSSEGDFFIPFAHTARFKTMKADAARSIIQTNIQRWHSSGSVVEVNPTDYLDIRLLPSGALEVRPGRAYPQGLGWGNNGFAAADESRVAIPLTSFGAWYYRQTELTEAELLVNGLRKKLMDDLALTAAEVELIFIEDTWVPTPQSAPLTDREVFDTVQESASNWGDKQPVITESLPEHLDKVRSMVTISRRTDRASGWAWKWAPMWACYH